MYFVLGRAMSLRSTLWRATSQAEVSARLLWSVLTMNMASRWRWPCIKTQRGGQYDDHRHKPDIRTRGARNADSVAKGEGVGSRRRLLHWISRSGRGLWHGIWRHGATPPRARHICIRGSPGSAEDWRSAQWNG